MRIDAHCDTVSWLNQFDSLRELPESHSDFSRLSQELELAFFAFFIDARKYRGREAEKALALLEKFLAQTEEHADLVEPLLWREQLEKKAEKSWVLIAAEGGEILGDEAVLLPLWYRLGLRSLGFTWNLRNQLADGCWEEWGLSNLGKKVLAACNARGIIPDAAHIAGRGFEQMLALSSKPIIVSHAACDSLCSHPRNLSDEQLKALARQGGVLGITFVADFLHPQGGGLEDLIRHIIHGVEKAGIDHIGIGSDFDGAHLCRGINGVEDLPLLWQALEKAGFNQKEIAKIQGGNFLRILQQTLPSHNQEQGSNGGENVRF